MANYNQKFEMSLAYASMALLLITMTWRHGTMAQSSSDCTNAIISMSSCLNYIQGNTSTPSSGCCSHLSSVVNTQPQCLCQVLNGGGLSLGLNINQTQALQLPKVCNVQTPPVSQCNTAAPPAKSPEGKAPASTLPSGKGSNSVPTTTDTNSSDATPMKMGGAPLLTFFILFMASSLFLFV